MCNCLGIWLRDIQKNETGCFETRNVDVSQANEFSTSPLILNKTTNDIVSPFVNFVSFTHILTRNVRWRQPKTSNMAVQVDAYEIDSFSLSKDLPKTGMNGGASFNAANDDADADDAVPFLRINGSIPNSGFSGWWPNRF